MLKNHPDRRRSLPMRTCKFCGSTWFRRADYYQFRDEEEVSTWPGETDQPVLTGKLNNNFIPIGICLCGNPWNPVGREPEDFLREDFRSSEFAAFPGSADMIQFMKSLALAYRTKDYTAFRETEIDKELTKKDEFGVQRRRLKVWERKVGKYIRPGRGRSWEFPHRKAAPGRDQFVLEVENFGYTSREAKRFVSTFWKVAAEGLKRDGELQVSPLGVFKIEHCSPQYRKRFGREQVLYRLPRIRFEPDRKLVRDLNFGFKQIGLPQQTSSRENRTSMAKEQVVCKVCGSSVFTEGEFWQWLVASDTRPGADLNRRSENPGRILVCLCGNPIRPGKFRNFTIPPLERESFKESLDAAIVWRVSVLPEFVQQRLLHEFVPRSAYDKMVAQMEQLENIVRNLLVQSKPPGAASPPQSSPTVKRSSTGKKSKKKNKQTPTKKTQKNRSAPHAP